MSALEHFTALVGQAPARLLDMGGSGHLSGVAMPLTAQTMQAATGCGRG